MIQSILHEGKPLSKEERAQFEKERRQEWFARTLEALLAVASHDEAQARLLCKRVADAFGPDDKLSAVLLKRLRTDRKGRNKGQRRKWDFARYYQLLVHYHIACKDVGRKMALLELAKVAGFSGENMEKKIEQRITEARKCINAHKLPDFLRPPPQHKSGG